MDRRGFLGRLLASVGALAIAPHDLLWKPVNDIALPTLSPEALVTLSDITKEIARELALLWQGREITAASKIGVDGLKHQFNIGMHAPPELLDEFGLDRERYVKPIAEQFAYKLNGIGATRSGTLGLPLHGADGYIALIPSAGVVVRGLCQYNLDWDHHDLRFDVLAGA